MNEDELDVELEAELRDLLADESTWAEPAPGGADALLAAIRATPPSERPSPPEAREGEGAAGPGWPQPAEAVPLVARRRRRGPWLLAAAAAVVVVLGVVGALVVSGGSDDAIEGREVAIGGTDLAPGASAVALVDERPSGVLIELDVRDLPPSEPGTYYQGWVKSPDGETVTIGTFHMRGGDDVVELWAGVDLADYPTLTVTLQQEGAGPQSSGQVVLTGQIGP